MGKRSTAIVMMVVVALAVMLTAQTVPAAEYTVTCSVDYTGPYGVIMPQFETSRKAFFAWWNETKGKELGITLKSKAYDMRYDPSVVASTWPGILTGDKPIALGEAGPVPTLELLEKQPRWTWFMAWFELGIQYQEWDKYKKLFNASRCINHDNLPWCPVKKPRLHAPVLK